MESRGDSAPKQDEISFKELVLQLRSWYIFQKGKKKKIMLIAVTGALLGLLYGLLEKPEYKSETRFVLENSGKSKMDYTNIAARFGINLGGSTAGIFTDDDNIMAFIKSRTMIAKTLRTPVLIGGRQQLLIDRYLDFNGYTEDWKDNKRLASVKFNQDPAQSTILEDSIITECYKAILDDNLMVEKPDKELSIISVKTITKDELFSKQFTETLMENVTRFYIEMQTKRSAENVKILKFQVDSVRNVLNMALAGAAVTSDANPNPNPAMQRLRVPSQRRLVDVEINKAILEELVKNLELSELTLRKETPLVQLIDQSVLPLEKKKFGKAKSIVLGFILGGLLSVVWFSIRKYFADLMA